MHAPTIGGMVIGLAGAALLVSPAVRGSSINHALLAGFFTLQPNEARVLVLFGKYRGTVRESGFHWGNPFYSNGQQIGVVGAVPVEPSKAAGRGRGKGTFNRNKISLRARTINVEKLKVNDKRGNPIEIGAVMVWRVQDRAVFVLDVYF